MNPYLIALIAVVVVSAVWIGLLWQKLSDERADHMGTKIKVNNALTDANLTVKAARERVDSLLAELDGDAD